MKGQLRALYESVVPSAVFYAVVSWGSSITAKDTDKLNKIIRKATSVLGAKLDTAEMETERQMLAKVSTIMKNSSHTLHKTLQGQKEYTEWQIAPALLQEGMLLQIIATNRLCNYN